MKRLKSIVAAVLAVGCVLTVTGCEEETPVSGGNSTPAPGGSTPPVASTPTSTATMNEEDAEKVAQIDIGAEKLENPVVKFLSEWDLNPAEGQPISVALEMFQTQFGGRIELVRTSFDERYTMLSTLIASDESPDMFSAGDMDIFPKGALNGNFQPLDPYVDFDSELWAPMKNVNDQFCANGKHYVGAINVESDSVMFYNKKTIVNNGLDDPVELLNQGKWDWDALWKMMTQFCNRDEGKFATDGWWFEGAISLTTGKPYIGMENGKVVHNLDDPMIEKVQAYMLNMKENDLPCPKSERGWKIQPDDIGKGNTLFYAVGTYALYPYNNIIQDFGNMEDVMFVPMPKCPDADAYYLPSRVSGFALVKGAKNPKGVAAYLNCEMASRDSDIAKEIGMRQAFDEYGWTQEQWDMLERVVDMTAEHPVIEMYNAVTPTIADYINNPMKEGYNSGAGWTQTRDAIRGPVQSELDSVNAKLNS
ncbi:MAG: ABC transporter substrate-binding protein [Oscillospiraceae bacterium]|nr:ABC transporter substrate-binding protein [Oscillospiraceae bacterium]